MGRGWLHVVLDEIRALAVNFGKFLYDCFALAASDYYSHTVSVVASSALKFCSWAQLTTSNPLCCLKLRFQRLLVCFAPICDQVCNIKSESPKSPGSRSQECEHWYYNKQRNEHCVRCYCCGSRSKCEMQCARTICLAHLDNALFNCTVTLSLPNIHTTSSVRQLENFLDSKFLLTPSSWSSCEKAMILSYAESDSVW